MKRILLVALIACGSLAALAAPVPKDKAAEPPPATDKQRDQSVNNLKLILLAMHNGQIVQSGVLLIQAFL